MTERLSDPLQSVTGMNMSGQRWDSAQMNAIFHRDGPLLVAAGPGAGKTSVIISHMNYLISQCHVHPESILVVTFTKAAAQEMKERYLAMSDSPSQTATGTDGSAGKKSAPPSPPSALSPAGVHAWQHCSIPSILQHLLPFLVIFTLNFIFSFFS